MKMLKMLSGEYGEECKIDIELLHESLLHLPAEKYLDLFRKMQMKIYGYPSLAEFGGCGVISEESEDETV